MAKKYDLSKKSDLRRFKKESMKNLQDSIVTQVLDRAYDVECPHCKAKISVRPGHGLCVACGGEINLELNINP